MRYSLKNCRIYHQCHHLQSPPRCTTAVASDRVVAPARCLVLQYWCQRKSHGHRFVDFLQSRKIHK